MKLKRIATIVLGACVGVFFNTASFAQSTGAQQPTVKQSITNVKDKCGYEIQKLCSDVTPGQGRVAACLDAKENQLSNSCKAAFTSAKANVSNKIDRADVEFRKACTGDVDMYCSNVPSGKGRILSCLNQHQSALSSSCKNFQARLEQKIDENLS